MPLRLVLLVIVALRLVTSAAAQDVPLPGLCGKLSNGVYTAPDNLYKVPVPVLPELGGRIHDTESVVTFDDDLNTHLSIACFPLDQDQKWELDTRGLKGYLGYFYVGFVFPDFQRRFPGASTEATFYVPELVHGSLLAVTLLPGGSFFDAQARAVAGPDSPPAVAKRGNLLFVHQGSIFVVSLELAERVTLGKAFGKTPEEENVILREHLVTFARRIVFPTPPRPPKS